MDEPTFSHSQASDLLAAAARMEANSARSTEPRLTLAELREAAESAGIDPRWVDAAFHAQSDQIRFEPYLGMPTGIHRTVLLPGPMDDAGWARIAREVNQSLGNKTVEQETSTGRRWSVQQVTVTAESAGPDTVVHLRADWSAAAKVFPWLAIGSVFFTALFGVAGLVFSNALLVTSGVFALLSVIYASVAWLAYPSVNRSTKRRFDALAERLELLADRSGEPSAQAADRAPGEREEVSGRLRLEPQIEETESITTHGKARDHA